MKNSDDIKIIVLASDNIKVDEIDNAKIIRIKDKKYNLYIMRNYWPVLGEIDGSIYIEADEPHSFENIKGFYTLSHNIFHLIIKE